MRWLIFLPLAAFLAAQDPPVVLCTVSDRAAIDLTLYHPYTGEDGSHSGFGLLREIRRIKVPKGTFTLKWMGLPREVTEASAQLEQISGGTRLVSMERNYDSNLLTPKSIQSASLGLPIQVKRTDRRTNPAILRSIPSAGDPSIVVETSEGFESVPLDSVALSRLPEGLLSQPTLSTLLASDEAGEVELRLTLLVERMKWTAHYNLDVEPTFTSGRLEGFARIENRSGMSFEGVRLALVAGPVTRTWKDAAWLVDGLQYARQPAEAVVEVVAAPVQEPLGEVHLFYWPHPFTLGALQEKQVALLTRPKVKVVPSVACVALLGQGWAKEDHESASAKLLLRVINGTTDEGSGPWPEGTWTLRLPTPEGLPLLIQDSASSIPTGETQEFSSGPLRIDTRSRRVASRRPWWGPFDQEETWEVDVAWDQTFALPGPGFLKVVTLHDEDITGPSGTERLDVGSYRLPLNLDRNSNHTYRFTVRYRKPNFP